jgi:4'-phosphopantetheinyl transferase
MTNDLSSEPDRRNSLLTCEVHVWYVLTDKITSPDLLGRYRSILSDAERERNDRYIFEKDRRLGLVSRALARWTLSQYRDIKPAAWEFVENRYGRPELATTFSPDLSHADARKQPRSLSVVTGQCPCDAPLRFNLTHTAGLVACAVTETCDTGVDAENVARRPFDWQTIAQRNFAPREIEQIQALPLEVQKAAFFQFWTLKEAYIKACGMGLSLPLDAFAFELRPGSRPSVSFEPPLYEDPYAWQFASFSPTADHKLAVAVRKGDRPDLSVILRETVPLP